MKKLLVLSLVVTIAVLNGCSGGGGKSESKEKKVKVAFVTNGVASFWDIAKVGAEKAAKEFNVDLEVRMPSNEGVADQKRQVEELLAQGIDGIAISPIDPDNQTDMLNEAADQTNLITHDSDAPKSKRICYVGISNYAAGRMCGQLVKDAIPDGGSVMIFVGRVEQLNVRHRRQGLIDELLGRTDDESRFDPTDEVIKGDKYTILGTLTDKFDFAEAKRLAEETIAQHKDLDCMVGLFAYNPTKILDALKSAGKLGDIKVVGFDEEKECLDAIGTGHCEGTVVQNPYRYGYESVKILAKLAKGDKSVLPQGNFLNIPARKIKKDNVEKFRAELEANLSKAGPAKKEEPKKEEPKKEEPKKEEPKKEAKKEEPKKEAAKKDDAKKDEKKEK